MRLIQALVASVPIPQIDVGATLVVARPAPVAEIVPEGVLVLVA